MAHAKNAYSEHNKELILKDKECFGPRVRSYEQGWIIKGWIFID